MQVYEPSLIETAINSSFTAVANAAVFTMLSSNDTYMLDETASFLAPVQPVAGQAFKITVGGNILQPVDIAAVYLNCNLNGSSNLGLNSDYIFKIPTGPFSYTFSVPANQAGPGVWSCDQLFVYWTGSYVSVTLIDFSL